MNRKQKMSRMSGHLGVNPRGLNWRTKTGHLLRGPVQLATAGCLGVVLLLNWAVPLQSAQAATNSATPLVIAVPSVPTSFDDSFAYQGVASQYADLQVGDGLLRFKPLAPGATKLQSATDLVGQLAQSWTPTATGGYNFVLRAAGSPAGDVVTAQDVAWSFQRFFALDGSAQFLGQWANINEKDPITIVSPTEVTLNVTSYSNLTLPILASQPFSQILDYQDLQSHITTADPWAEAWLADHSDTFGAYQLTSFTAGQSLTLTANPHFWDAGVPAIQTVIFKAVADAGTRLLLVKSGQVGFATALTYPLLKSADGKVPGYKVVPAKTANIDYFVTDDKTAPFNNTKVRLALSMALNRQAILSSVYDGFGKVANYEMSSVTVLPTEPKAIYTQYNPTKAKRMLAAAGYPKGLHFTLDINPDTGPGPQAQSLATVIQSELAKIGVKVTIDNVASDSEYATGLNNHKFGAYLNEVTPNVLDPGYDADLDFNPAGVNLSDVQNAQMTVLTNAINSTPPGAKRTASVIALENLLNKTIPMIPLVETVSPWIMKSDIMGAAANSLGSLNIYDLYYKG